MNILQILPQWAETIVSCIFAVLIGSSIIVVLSENKSPIRALAWILALILLPVAGLVFYLFFGRGVKSIHLQSRRRKRKLLHNRKHQRVDYSEAGLSESAKTVARLAEKIGKHPVTIGNEVEIFTDGMSKFEALKSDLAYAEKLILPQKRLIY